MIVKNIFAAFLVSAALCFAQGCVPLTLYRTIPLPDVKGRIDHFSVDVTGRRLFVAALGNGSVEVVDLKSGKVVHAIGPLKEPQGVLYFPENNQLYVATGGDGTVRIFDGTTFQLIKTIPLGDDADNIRYDAGSHRIYLGYGSGALAITDRQGRREAQIPLDAHPESFQIAKNRSEIFVNVPDAKEIAVVDPNKKAVIAKWSTGSALANFPMALDERSRRLFVVCRRPARLLCLDANSGKIVQELPSVGDADDLFYDASRHRLYVTGGQGAVGVYAEQGDTLVQLDRVSTAPGARTSLFVPQLNHLFVAAPRNASQTAKLFEFEVR